MLFYVCSENGTDIESQDCQYLLNQQTLIKAVNNIDGDCFENHFTGGNHQYNNTGVGSTCTARGEITGAYFDGKKMSDFDGYCSKVDIYWTNYIQGQNTKKVDGTGREILQENYHLTYDGGGGRFWWKIQLHL